MAELKLIADLCIKYDVYAIMDEVYEHIVYDGPQAHLHEQPARHVGAHRSSCSSLSKTYSVTGWRLGYAIAPKEIMDRIKQYHDFNTVGAASPLMEAAIVGLDMPDSYYQGVRRSLCPHEEAVHRGPGPDRHPLSPIPRAPTSSWPTSAPIMQARPSPTWSSAEKMAAEGRRGLPSPARRSLNEDVNHIVRVHFAKKDETLLEALDRLSHLKEKMAR